MQDEWSVVDTYINNLFVPSDPVMDEVLSASDNAGLPSIQVAPNQGKFLQLLAMIHGARKILEVGTLGGYSTIWLARALPQDGRLITLESEPTHAEVARANIARAGMSQLVEVRLGQAADTLSELVAEKRGPFDFIFIDADKPGYADYLAWALRLSRKGTVIVADNVVRKGKVVDRFSADEKVQGIRRFNQALKNEPRVSATEIQTVGTKGYDGFALAIVISD